MDGKKFDLGAELFDWAQSLVSAIVAIVLIFAFVAGVFSVQQTSMLDTLQEGDMLLISDLFYTPGHGDIVMFSKYGVFQSYDPETGSYSPFVKRVIGLPGDVLKFEDGVLYINGEARDEPYIREENWRWPSDGAMPASVTVPEGQYFLMGDNRNVSHDSRSADIGFVDRRCILGRVLLRIAPLKRFGGV